MADRITNEFFDTVFKSLLLCAAVFSALVVLSIFLFLLFFSFPLFTLPHLTQLLSIAWRPFQNQYGILPMLFVSLILSLFSLITAFPLALGICGFAYGLGPRRLARAVMTIIQFMTSIPTIVYGFVSVFLLVPKLRDCFSANSGFSLLAAVVTLSILILPTIVLIIHSQLQIIEPRVRLTAESLGIPASRKFLWILLPAAKQGLFAALLLGFGRAVGDTIVALMVAGNAAQLPHSLHDSVRTLTSHIALVVATDSTSMIYHSLFACGLLLFFISFTLNLTLRWVQRKLFADGN
jgi:phosphate transport system permease protein